MLKFFREYNKYILVVGGAILMVAFLVQPALQSFMPQPGNRVIGTVHGQEITGGAQRTAASELFILNRLGLVGRTGSDAELRWLLMVRDARRMGLSASTAAVNGLLNEVGFSDSDIARLQQQVRGATKGFIHQAVRHWLMIEDYQELLLGRTHVPAQTRARMMMMARQAVRQRNIYAMMKLRQMAQSSDRLSVPLIRHFLWDQQSRVSGEAVLISSSRYLDTQHPPDPEELKSLYNKYKDKLPGQTKPYGFGYRTPDRVKFESLIIPLARLKAQVHIEEADALQYYQSHKDQYRAAPAAGAPGNDNQSGSPDKGKVKAYAQVREKVHQTLRRKRAAKLAAKMAKTARNLLMEQPALRQLPREGGYRKIPQSFKPMPLDKAARRLQARFDVKPEIKRASGDWTPVSKLKTLPALSGAGLAARPRVTLTQYVSSAKELAPKTDNPLVPLRLQAGVPSEPMRLSDGSYMLFRLTAAEAAHDPKNLDAVRGEVVRDARKLEAYKKLLSERDQWLTKAKRDGLRALSNELKEPMLHVPPTALRSLGAGTAVSSVSGIGRSETFLTAMFNLAQKLASETGASKSSHAGKTIKKMPRDQRLGAARIDEKLGLAIFRVDQFDPIDQTQYDNYAGSPVLGAQLTNTLLTSPDAPNPLSLKSIKRRVGWQARG